MRPSRGPTAADRGRDGVRGEEAAEPRAGAHHVGRQRGEEGEVGHCAEDHVERVVHCHPAARGRGGETWEKETTKR